MGTAPGGNHFSSVGWQVFFVYIQPLLYDSQLGFGWSLGSFDLLDTHGSTFLLLCPFCGSVGFLSTSWLVTKKINWLIKTDKGSSCSSTYKEASFANDATGASSTEQHLSIPQTNTN